MPISSFTALAKAIQEKNLLKKYHLAKLGIFGSFVRGESAKDIDFYVDADPYNLHELASLKKELEQLTEKDADIMLKKYANPIILYRAQKDMKYVRG
ncbi:putative nucleotidyltransferases [Candidatus Termititenax aidoneus]|uniref:Nucleotidyltransferases n=1 Tax=Termititenax aidoneus TaxID=2218524 RepID=A0A388TCR2_TERA1|nr:putative nucleotidyltransferases [Candidatus Termititenax aidoneus]